VTGPATVSGHEFKEGDKVILFYNSANRDEDVFENPDRFDVTSQPNPHIGFGAAGPALLSRGPSGPAGDHRDVPELFKHLPDIHGHGRARPAAVELHQRHQAPAVHLHPRRPVTSDD
jgi:hypothetical protein